VPNSRAQTFLADAEAAVDLLRQQPGFVTATIGRATDDADLWVVTTVWSDVGSFRRALSSYDVKLGAVPLLSSAIDEPTAFEQLVQADSAGLRRRTSDRASDADWSGPSHVG
jgi:quinol monooxygenase YgiN